MQVEALSTSALLGGKPTQAAGPLPAVLYNKHSSRYFVEHLGLHFASSREAFMGCEYTTPFVTFQQAKSA